MGSANETIVISKLSNTVRLRPILFINKPVGTEKIRNHTNTIEGRMLAIVSESPKSSLA